MQVRYGVERILKQRILDGKEEFPVRWSGNYKPSWQSGEVIRADCPALVEEFVVGPPLIRGLKCTIAPSSPGLSWETVAGLLGITILQGRWKPVLKPAPKPSPNNQTTGRTYILPSIEALKIYSDYVEEMYDEAGKFPLLSNLLVDALHVYPRKGSRIFTIIPQSRLLKGHEYKSDYVVAVVEVNNRGRVTKPLILYEMKKQVSNFLATIDAKHLAQTLVEGYYVLMGSECDMESIVVALTDVAITNYFKIKLPVTRDRDSRRSLEVVWHKPLNMHRYPPADMEDLFPFVDSVHEILNESV